MKTKAANDTFVIGRHPIMDGLKDGVRFEKIWIDQGIRGPFEKELRYLCRQEQIPLQVVPKNKLDFICRNKSNQGVAGQISLISYQDIEEIIPWCYEQGKAPFILILDSVEDVRNLGAISRTALWFGIDAIVVPFKNTARINSGAIKSSAGALLKMKICKVQSISTTIGYLQQSGIKIFGADMEGSDLNELEKMDIQGVALLMGSEAKGIHRDLKSHCDEILSIPGTGEMDSLNVSVATGILLHELYRYLK